MSLNELNKIYQSDFHSPKMPVLFLGHGSPMNAIEENEFVQGFRKISTEIPRPKAILCISAHWVTNGTQVTAMKNPKTIHDFGGFPEELYEVQYPAPGEPFLAEEVKEKARTAQIHLDDKWGLDHGAWSVIKHLYPEADIPVVELSLDYNKSGQSHFELAKELKAFREKGVLIIGSGNIVHNLRLLDWGSLNREYAYDWATEANEKMKQFVLNGDFESLIHYERQGRAFQLSIPTPEHYLPLIYSLALKDKNENISLFNDKPVGGSMSMTSMKIGS